MDRGERRRRTERIARRRQAEHATSCSKSIVDRASWAQCFCEDVGLGFWETHRPYSCGCSNRKDGRPRVNRGMCGFGMRDRIYRWRAQERELRRLLARGCDPEGDRAAVLTDARSEAKTGLWRP